MIELHDTAPAAAEPPRLPRSLRCLERVHELAAPLLDELAADLPRLKPWKRFSGGAFVLGLHTRNAPGERLPFSRIHFELRADAALDACELTCRRTVRGRDRASVHLAVQLDEAGEARLQAWLEARMLEFAAGYRGADEAESARLAAEAGA